MLNLQCKIPLREGGLIRKRGGGKLRLSFATIPNENKLNEEQTREILEDIAEEGLSVCYIDKKTKALDSFAFSSQLTLPEKGYVVMNEKTPLIYLAKDKLPEDYVEFFDNLATAF
jgi:hypothetical protein